MSTNISHNATLNFTTFYNVIDGELLASSSNEVYNTKNPSTLETNPDVPLSTHDDVDKAVRAAQRAAEGWADTAWEERKAALLRFSAAFEAQAQGFAKMLVRENGKPLSSALNEIHTSVRWISGVCNLTLPETVIEDTLQRRVVEHFVPLGVAVGIVPWNFPVALSFFKLPAALLTGNTFILKPSPFTPYCSLKLAELGRQFFPPGVFQALSGDDRLGPWLTEHPGVDKIAFTGSIATGKRISQSCGLKRLTLELGGNDPAIICEDVDIAKVVPVVATIAFVNSGQLCMAIKRLYIHESIYDDFSKALVTYVETHIKVGDGFENGNFMGPICHESQFNRVKEYLIDIERNGLKVLTGSTKALERKGFFIAPMIIDNPPETSRIVTEEPFGPILPLMKWSDEADVIQRANETEYGLGASVWAKNMVRAGRISKKIKAGTIWINTHGELEPNVAFGCHKNSGCGVELGVEGLKAYCNTQSIYTKPGA